MTLESMDWENFYHGHGSSSEAWQQLASSANAQVFYHAGDKVYLKFFPDSRLRNQIKTLILPPLARHRRFVRNGRKLREAGLNAPSVLDHGITSDLDRRKKVGYVLTAAFDGMGLGSFCSQYLVRSSTDSRIRQWKRRVMEALGAEIAKLHNAGISHGDLRPDNVLLSCSSPEPRFCFIDNERNRQHVFGITRGAVVKNLVQLNMIWPEDLGASYRLRFLRSYLAHSTTRSLDGRALMRRVHAVTQRRLKGKARGGYLDSDRQICRPDFSALLRGL